MVTPVSPAGIGGDSGSISVSSADTVIQQQAGMLGSTSLHSPAVPQRLPPNSTPEMVEPGVDAVHCLCIGRFSRNDQGAHDVSIL